MMIGSEGISSKARNFLKKDLLQKEKEYFKVT